MSYKSCFLGILLLLLVVPAAAFGQEIFSASLTGTEACGDFNAGKIKQTIFVAFADTGIVFAADAQFNIILAAAQMYQVYQTSNTAIAFSAFENDSDVIGVAIGTAKVNGNVVLSFTGTLNALSSNGCFISGTVKSGKRLL